VSAKEPYTYEELRQKLFELIDTHAALQAKADRLAEALEETARNLDTTYPDSKDALEDAREALADYRGSREAEQGDGYRKIGLA